MSITPTAAKPLVIVGYRENSDFYWRGQHDGSIGSAFVVMTADSRERASEFIADFFWSGLDNLEDSPHRHCNVNRCVLVFTDARQMTEYGLYQLPSTCTGVEAIRVPFLSDDNERPEANDEAAAWSDELERWLRAEVGRRLADKNAHEAEKRAREAAQVKAAQDALKKENELEQLARLKAKYEVN